MKKVELIRYKNEWYQPGNSIKIFLWYFINILFFKTSIPFSSSVKVMLLRMFGAKVGHGVVIKNNVNIKFPWFLEIESYVWVGENVWIDNLTKVSIGSNVCLSQGSYLLTGGHNYKKSEFDLILDAIVLEDGVWIGAKSVVCPGVTCRSHSVLAVSSVATNDLENYMIYQGNPAKPKRSRVIT
jgi:putative colanic acid biosynthesis acetyltransferase WcaF